MKELKQLITRFLESCGLGKTDYMYIPMGATEIHVRPFAVMTTEEMEKIIKSGAEFGFEIANRKAARFRTDLRELAFLIKEVDLPRIKTAMQSITLTAGEFAQVNE